MSDSSIRVNPSIEEPSNWISPSSAFSNCDLGISTFLITPKMSVNWSLRNRTLSALQTFRISDFVRPGPAASNFRIFAFGTPPSFFRKICRLLRSFFRKSTSFSQADTENPIALHTTVCNWAPDTPTTRGYNHNMEKTGGRWPSRQEAQDLLFEFTKGDALRRHGRAVEQAMRAYAGWFDVTDPAEVERWGIVGLLHDFDYEQNPTEDTHLHVGGRILRERGYDEEMVRTIESHANYMQVPRDTPMKKAIYACDELVGFIGAYVKVRPTKQVADMPVSSVVKRLKDKAFARSVNREDISGGAAGLPRPLEEHI